MADEFEAIKAVPTRVDLKERFPLTLRYIFCKSFWFLLATGLIAAARIWIGTYHPPINDPSLEIAHGAIQKGMGSFFDYLFFAAFICTVLKLIYEFVFRAMFTYSIELEHLTVTRGIFFRSRSSFPLARINDVSLKRTPVEMLFLLYAIDVLTASPISTYGRIEGLSKKDAVDLQTYLLALVETTLPDVREKAADQAQTKKLSPPEVDKLIHGEDLASEKA